MSHPRAHPPLTGWLILNLMFQISFGLMTMTLSLPSMQEWGQIFGADQAAVQLTFSAYVMAYGGMQLVYGPLSDRHGRKRVMMIGLAVAGLGSLMGALSTSLSSLIAARVLQGMGGAASIVVGRSMVQDLFEGPQRTRVMAYIGMVMGLCPPLGTIVGGQLHVRLGWSSVFWTGTVLAVILLLAAWRGLPTRAAAPVHETHWLRDFINAYVRLAREPVFLLYVVVLAGTTACFYVFMSGTPIVLGAYGVKPDGVGWYIMCVPLFYMVGNFLTSRLIHRIGERRIMVVGQALSMLALLLMLSLFALGWRTPLAFALPLMLMGLGHGFLNPPALAGTVGVVPSLAGSAAGVAGLTQQMMGAFGGLLVGMFHHDGPLQLGLLMLSFTLIAGVAMLLLLRRTG
jgi:DHA1 family bicyclomycin/chloramphenicol resistance-like MFS transporter